ncbi:MAG: hypothetical protein JW810_02450 [Sedimentisphaerales bacterium]|nr:hypothetical protein [Sedimentisphaerales bacterium]
MLGAFLYYGSLVDASPAAHDGVEAKSKASQLAGRLKLAEANIAKIMMIQEAMWEIVRDALKLSDDDLNAKLCEVDMRDGKLDERNQRPIRPCPACGRNVSGRHPACIYCGQVIDETVFHLK